MEYNLKLHGFEVYLAEDGPSPFKSTVLFLCACRDDLVYLAIYSVFQAGGLAPAWNNILRDLPI